MKPLIGLDLDEVKTILSERKAILDYFITLSMSEIKVYFFALPETINVFRKYGEVSNPIPEIADLYYCITINQMRDFTVVQWLLFEFDSSLSQEANQ